MHPSDSPIRLTLRSVRNQGDRLDNSINQYVAEIGPSSLVSINRYLFFEIYSSYRNPKGLAKNGTTELGSVVLLILTGVTCVVWALHFTLSQKIRGGPQLLFLSFYFSHSEWSGIITSFSLFFSFSLTYNTTYLREINFNCTMVIWLLPSEVITKNKHCYMLLLAIHYHPPFSFKLDSSLLMTHSLHFNRQHRLHSLFLGSLPPVLPAPSRIASLSISQACTQLGLPLKK